MDEKRPRIKNNRILRERIEKFISPTYFSDVNLNKKLYKHQQKIKSLFHYHAPGRISFSQATSKDAIYKQVKIGDIFGPTWSTHWFRIDIDLQNDLNWKGNEIRLRWNSCTEAMVWIDGRPMQGLTGSCDNHQLRTDYILVSKSNGNETFEIYIEMAANGMFGNGKDGMINTPDPEKYFTLNMVELAVMDHDISSIITDLKLLVDIHKELPEENVLSQSALQIGCNIVNCFQPYSIESVSRAKKITDSFFSRNTGLGEDTFRYNVHAIGNCHIDTAWLWPYAETERKCARSWSSAVDLMKRYPQYKFACSQAQQIDWVKQKYPSLYADILKYAEKGNFIPVGGTWVEMDGNLPSAEGFIRQFLYGQRFFKKEFGNYCDVFWLPDTFGYSCQLPQIIQQAGIKYFLTQKISWSLINKFPHNSFIWQGLDGSRVLTHFPPADTYESSVSFGDVLKTSMQNKDKGIVYDGMLLYGYGDGGGGPTEEMIQRIERLKDIPLLPRVKHSTPSEYFKQLENASHLLHTWVGELYLELHQGTFTSQALIKKRNRQCEFLLQKLELLQTWVRLNDPKSFKERNDDSMEIQLLWKKVLLNQFHDVLPGSCIKEVADDAEKLYQEVIEGCEALRKKYFKILLQQSDRSVNRTTAGFEMIVSALNVAIEHIYHKGALFIPSGVKHPMSRPMDHLSSRTVFIFNTQAWKRCELVTLPEDNIHTTVAQKMVDPCTETPLCYVCVEVDACACTDFRFVEDLEHVHIEQDTSDESISLTNQHLSAKFNKYGQMTSCVFSKTNRECVKSGLVGNAFYLYTDIPLYWDAWDVMPYNEETRQILTNSTSIEIIENGPLRASFRVTLKISESSSITQTISLDMPSEYIRFDTQVEWNENRKMLKVGFPVNVHTEYATYEIQAGSIRRPTHCNTSWDAAKYEVCGHKWVDLSEYDFGVSLINDCKYGFSAYGSTLQMSLLRSPKSPDDQADMGMHSFSYAFMPHYGSFQQANVIKRAYDFQNSMYSCFGSQNASPKKLFFIDQPSVILDTVKLCEDNKDYVIVRMYESYGGFCQNVKLISEYQLKDVFRTNLLEEREDPGSNIKLCTSYEVEFSIKAFEILTLCLVIKDS